MSLYNHVANKEDIVDGLVDIVFGEIEVAVARLGRLAERLMRRAGRSPSAPRSTPSLGGRADGGGGCCPGPANTRNHKRGDWCCLREGGFAFRDAVHGLFPSSGRLHLRLRLQERGLLMFDVARGDRAGHAQAARERSPRCDDLPLPRGDPRAELEKAGLQTTRRSSRSAWSSSSTAWSPSAARTAGRAEARRAVVDVALARRAVAREAPAPWR